MLATFSLRSTLLAFVLLLGAIAVGVVRGEATPGRDSSLAATALSSPTSAVGPVVPAAAVDGWPLKDLETAIEAFRSGDLKRASDSIGEKTRNPQYALLLGLFAHGQADIDRAIALLQHGHDPTGQLNDWRLYLLADSLAAKDQHAGARATLDRLLTYHPESPLFHQAYTKQLESLHGQGDWLGALRGIEAARHAGFAQELGPSIDTLQWTIAQEGDLDDLLRAAARRLLVHHPLEASTLQVIDTFRSQDGEIEWNKILSAPQLLERARNLLEVEISEGALQALNEIPTTERSIDWFLLRGEALIAEDRGQEALALLQSKPSVSPERLPELLLLRSEAALEGSRVKRGRDNADSETRERFRGLAWNDLRQVSRRGTTEQRKQALNALYGLSDPEEALDTSLEVLRQLRALDPEDVTGYRDLWKLGWREFSRNNRTVAISIWRELQDLYPETSRARQALYWSGVAHSEIGNRDRGRYLLEQVLESDTVDFYSRHAARRLGVVATPATPLPETVDWPQDDSLARTALLSELGLDEIASIELGLLRDGADPRAVNALEALILARMGDRRQSIQSIWRAFRRLGHPGQTAIPTTVQRLYYPLDYSLTVDKWALSRELPPELVYGIIRQESAFDAGAISRAGARGLMQLMPATGKELAGKLRLSYSRDRLLTPDFSVQLGTQYFSQVLRMFDGNVELALAGYNGGPYRIKRWWREAGPNPEVDRFVEGLALAETVGYVKRITMFQDSYLRLYSRQ